MAKFTITAAEGVRAQVLTRKQVVLSRTLPAVLGSEGQVLIPEKTDTYRDTETLAVDTFTGGPHEFDIGPNDYLMVLEQ